ncbi:MAG TPA: hypothetical protein VH022_14345 [Candidatus Acidoferrum sp.]|jgi:hypothetical protein|nr:hypothetical protein [Candidatus Acidoferrum sp.]
MRDGPPRPIPPPAPPPEERNPGRAVPDAGLKPTAVRSPDPLSLDTVHDLVRAARDIVEMNPKIFAPQGSLAEDLKKRINVLAIRLKPYEFLP